MFALPYDREQVMIICTPVTSTATRFLGIMAVFLMQFDLTTSNNSYDCLRLY